MNVVVFCLACASLLDFSHSLSPEAIDGLSLIFNATQGTTWHHHTNWLIGDPCSGWYGVQCIGDSLSLNLNSNGLIGGLPELSGYVMNMSKLDLGNNMLNGTVPDFIYQIDGITYLDLSNNSFQGVVAPGIGNLIGLKKLFLQDNGFYGSIPSELSNLINLNHLDISRTQLCGCFRMNTYFPSCYAPQLNCGCNESLCGNSICLDSSCLKCEGLQYGSGTCSDAVVDSHYLNILQNITLSNLSSIIQGDMISENLNINFKFTMLSINGSMICPRSKLTFICTHIDIKGRMDYSESLLKLDFESSVVVTGALNLTGSSIILDLNYLTQQTNYTLITTASSSRSKWPPIQVINYPGPPCAVKQDNGKFALSIVINLDFCSTTSDINLGAIIGGVCGGVFGVVVVVGAVIAIRKFHKAEIELRRFSIPVPPQQIPTTD